MADLEKEPEHPAHVPLAEFQRRVHAFHAKYNFPRGLIYDLNQSFMALENKGSKVNIVDQINHDVNLLAWHKTGVERATLMQEELAELMRAWVTLDRVGIADALADLLYVVLGTAVAVGIEVAPLLVEVHASNMTKDVGEFKPIKGKDFKAPLLHPILEKQRII